VSVELLFTAIGTIGAVAASTASLAYWLGRKFAEIEKRFAEIDKRFEYVDKRFERIDKRFEEMDKKFEEVIKRIVELEGRFDELAQATRDQFEFFAEFLGFRGVLEARDVDFVKGELARLARLTEEELRRIRELVEKEELTLGEADELRELARKFVKEHDNVPGAWKLLIYASVMRGIALRKRGQREGSRTS